MNGDVSKPPLISVVMPVYNGERFVRDALESILCQSLQDIEVLVVDDASTDDTVAIVEAVGDSRVTVYRNDRNLGNYPSSNRGIAQSRGVYLVRHDADDISLPERFAKQVHEFERDPDLVLVGSEFIKIDEHGSTVDCRAASQNSGIDDALPFHLLFHNRIGAHCQVMMRGDVVRNLGGYPEDAPYSQDYALWLMLARMGKIRMIPEVLFQYRVHSSSISTAHNAEQRIASLQVSATHLEGVLQRPVSIQDAARLRDFYTRVAPDLDVNALSTVRGAMESILSWYPDYFGFELSASGRREIHEHIGAAFASCAYFSAKRLRPRSVATATTYAASYSPRGALGFVGWKVRRRLGAQRQRDSTDA